MLNIETKALDVKWLNNVQKETLIKVLLEYNLIQKNFVPWLCHIMANTENERIRQLLLPNLIEECGDFRKKNSHNDLYLRMLKFNNINVANHKYSKLTIETEKKYTKLFSSKNTYRSLCAIGPGIEAVSSDFILPMYIAVKNIFGESKHMIYFTLHLSEMEDEHADCIEDAMRIMEKDNPKLLDKREAYIKEGIEVFRNFWDNLPKHI